MNRRALSYKNKYRVQQEKILISRTTGERIKTVTEPDRAWLYRKHQKKKIAKKAWQPNKTYIMANADNAR